MAGVKGRSGGARVNSGPRRLTDEEIAVRGGRLRGTRRAAALATPGPAAAPAVHVSMPKGMPKAQHARWVALAPHATMLGTLTPATARSFGRLCEAMAVADRLLAQIETQGDTVDGDAHPLLSKWIALKVRVEAGEARFLVTANGKPTAAAPAPVVNPLDRFIKRA